MFTPRMRRRRRLLDTYVRVELQERGTLRDDRAEALRSEPAESRLRVIGEALDVSKDEPGDRPL